MPSGSGFWSALGYRPEPNHAVVDPIRLLFLVFENMYDSEKPGSSRLYTVYKKVVCGSDLDFGLTYMT